MVQGSKCELLWIKVGLCVYENGSSAKRGAILESCEKGSGFVKDSELFVLVCEIRERCVSAYKLTLRDGLGGC